MIIGTAGHIDHGKTALVRALTGVDTEPPAGGAGFGLLGHLLEICRGSGLTARIRFDRLPVLSTARILAPQGIGPGAIERKWAGYGHEVRLSPELPAWAQRLLCDPQTSGG